MTAGQEPAPVALAPTTVLRRNGNWLTAQIGEELIMMNSVTGRQIGLTQTGTRIWELLESPRSFAALCAALAAEYEASPDEIAGDIADFLRVLADYQAVALD